MCNVDVMELETPLVLWTNGDRKEHAQSAACSVDIADYRKKINGRAGRSALLCVVPSIFLSRNLLQDFGLMLARQTTFCEREGL